MRSSACGITMILPPASATFETCSQEVTVPAPIITLCRTVLQPDDADRGSGEFERHFDYAEPCLHQRRAYFSASPGVTCRDAAGVPDDSRRRNPDSGRPRRLNGPAYDLVCRARIARVDIDTGRIVHFSTHMTGEAFAIFKAHSILGRMMKDGVTDWDAFADGVRRSTDDRRMLHHLFGVRSGACSANCRSRPRRRTCPAC